MITVQEQKEDLAEVIRALNSKGWSPATSTNYSFKDEDGKVWVSRSGVDKSQFDADDFISVDPDGKPIGEFIGVKPSAETLIHTTLYHLFPETRVILHSHSIYPVLLSSKEGERIAFQGYEVQKGFEGQKTHENIIYIPIFDNSQDMLEFSGILTKNVDLLKYHSFLIRKHGTYAWGRDLFEAKRHLETIEYLSKCEWMLRLER